jgi:hypothetical protein
MNNLPALMIRGQAETGNHRRALGRSRGGFTGKFHCAADNLGQPLASNLKRGEAADCKAYRSPVACRSKRPTPC